MFHVELRDIKYLNIEYAIMSYASRLERVPQKLSSSSDCNEIVDEREGWILTNTPANQSVKIKQDLCLTVGELRCNS